MSSISIPAVPISCRELQQAGDVHQVECVASELGKVCRRFLRLQGSQSLTHLFVFKCPPIRQRGILGSGNFITVYNFSFDTVNSVTDPYLIDFIC